MLEDVAVVQTDIAAVQGDVAAVQGDVAAVQGDVAAVLNSNITKVLEDAERNSAGITSLGTRGH